jgi:hypothetical protein
MAITAKSRARTALSATTALSPDEALAAVKAATGEAKGGGASLLTSGLTNAGARVHVEREKSGRLSLSITSGKRLVELCTFSATARQSRGKTKLTVGGLDTYKTKQGTLFYLIPLGPKAIHGFSLYKRFLDQVATQLKARDTSASIAIAAPER